MIIIEQGLSRMVGLRFGQDARNELYILTKADGKMYELVSAGVKPLNGH